MSYTLTLLHGSTVLYTLPVTTFFQPKSSPVYDNYEPPTIVGIDKLWTIRGSLKSTSETNTATAWTTLRGFIEGTGTNQVNGAQLKQGTNLIEDLSTNGTYVQVKIESFECDPSPRPERGWHSEVGYVIKITGRRRLVNVRTLEETDVFSYSPEGLLTRTLTGTIETQSGTSATTQAQTLGLSLPGATYAYITNGPGGVNTEKLDLSDTRVRFISSYAQSGSALPSGVSPEFSVKVEKTTTKGEMLTVTTVTASGSGAAAAVAAQKPSGDLFSQAVTSDAFRLTAAAVYVQKQAAQPGRMLMLWAFSISGGQPGASATERTGGRQAALHVLPATPVRIRETVSVQVWGSPQDNDFTMPDALNIDGVLLDGGSQVDPGHRVEIGVTRAQDRWQAGCVRNYVAASVPANLPTLIGLSVLRPDSQYASATTPGKILKSAASGSGGNDLTGLGGLGIAGFQAPTAGDARLNLGMV